MRNTHGKKNEPRERRRGNKREAEDEPSEDEEAGATGGGGPGGDDGGSSPSDGDDDGKSAEEESESEDSSEEYKRMAEELERRYAKHKEKKANKRKNRRKKAKAPTHRKHERQKRPKKHPKMRREERRNFLQQLDETPISSEGSEPEDEYYYEPEVFTAASARIYDPYDLKGVTAPILHYGDDATRESFRVKYLDYITKHQTKMRKRAPRDRVLPQSVVECMKPSLLSYVCKHLLSEKISHRQT